MFHFFWKENWRKNRRWSPLPLGPSGNPPQAGLGVGGPRWLEPKNEEAERWELPPTTDDRRGWWLADVVWPLWPRQGLGYHGVPASPSRSLVHGQPRPAGSNTHRTPASCPCLSSNPTAPPALPFAYSLHPGPPPGPAVSPTIVPPGLCPCQALLDIQLGASLNADGSLPAEEAL